MIIGSSEEEQRLRDYYKTGDGGRQVARAAALSRRFCHRRRDGMLCPITPGDTAMNADVRSDPDRLEELLDIMARLRDPQHGCPWDIEQDFDSIAPYTLEEAYEVAEAIRCRDPQQLCDELGDLLFQVVFHARMAQEQGWFDFADVVASINRKLVERHPHVFGDADVADAAAQSRAWETHKARERAARADGESGALAGVPLALPALARAQKLQRRAARVGFDWVRRAQVMEKVREELEELTQALESPGAMSQQHEELGDLMFSCVNLARFIDADAESLMRAACHKFEARFNAMESELHTQGCALEECSLEQMEAVWQRVKRPVGFDGP